MKSQSISSEIYELIPHRPPMLLINEVVSLSATNSSALVHIDSSAPFYSSSGVPSWIGLEYMGQTAALIAGFQLREGLCKPHLGFLLGTRQFSADTDYFISGHSLLVSVEEGAVVGESLAKFNCIIEDSQSSNKLAKATLSVFRKPLEET